MLNNKLDFLLKSSKREKQKAFAVIFTIGLFGWIFNTYFGFFIDLTEVRCMPQTVYLGYPYTGELHKGDVISYRASNRVMLDLMTGRRIAKIVAGLPGDHVISDKDGLRINGQLVAERNPISLTNLTAKGKKALDIDKVLQEGEVLVIGKLPRSFDSRYWGVLPAKYIDRRIVPLF